MKQKAKGGSFLGLVACILLVAVVVLIGGIMLKYCPDVLGAIAVIASIILIGTAVYSTIQDFKK